MTGEQTIPEAIRAIHRPVHLREAGGRYALAQGVDGSGSNGAPRSGFAPACRLEDLGDPAFRADHRLRYAYVAGAMANGIGSADIVEAMGRAGMLAFFGAAGLPLARVESAIDRLSRTLGDVPHGFNLIH